MYPPLVNGPDQRADVWSAKGGDTVRTWTKPNGVSFVYLFMVAAGGGGGSKAAGVAQGGAGGGGSGSVTSALFHAWCVPDALGVIPGKGGPAGALGNNPGTVGDTLQIIALNTGSQIFTTPGGGGGNSAAGSGSQPGGTGAAAASQFGVWTAQAILFQSVAGVNGGNSGDSVSPGGAGLDGILAGGGGGAGTGAGGKSVGSFGYADVPGGSTQPGFPGYTIFKPLFLSTGGSGSGSGTPATNTTFADAGLGCGGGGAGANITNANIGGRGGDGFIRIASW